MHLPYVQAFHRLIETIIFLSSRGLAFRSDNQILASRHNGNYLGYLELISKFEPSLSTHIHKYANKGKRNVSYSSNTICDDLILSMTKTVLENIVQETITSKYFSIIIDSTPDIKS